MADLGQNSSVNMVTDSAALEYFSTNLTDTVEGQNTYGMAAWHATNPAMQSYSEVKDITGLLSITPSVISQQYLCQVPKLKSRGPLFVAVLLADLVFLQELWKIVTLIMDWRLGRSDCQAIFCESCAARDTMTAQYRPVTEHVRDG
jgi:hypothetical protein